MGAIGECTPGVTSREGHSSRHPALFILGRALHPLHKVIASALDVAGLLANASANEVNPNRSSPAFQRLIEVVDGLGIASLCQAGQGPIDPRLLNVRIQFDHAAEVGSGSGIVLLTQVGKASPKSGPMGVGLQSHCGRVGTCRVIVAGLAKLTVGQQIPKVDVAGIRSDSPFEEGRCSLELTAGIQFGCQQKVVVG